MPIHIRAVESSKDLHDFVTFPWRVYGDDPLWVPPLIGDEKKLLTPGKHPFYEHGSVQCFLAEAPDRSGRPRPAGRIAAIRNRNHESFHEEAVGFFGFFEALPTSGHLEREGLAGVRPEEVTEALMDAARRWTRDQGLPVIRGPLNPSTNETCALLVEGFDDPPQIMMPYNPREYAGLLEGAGLRKAKDLLAYRADAALIPDSLIRRAETAAERTGVTVRSLVMKDLRAEVERVQDVYNAAWEKNWGFVPMTPAELDHMAAELKHIVEPDLVCFAEKEGRVIGFGLALPDYNQALRHANGRLFPFGLLKILWHKRDINRLRVLALGVLAEYRRMGIDQLMYLTLWRNGKRLNYREGEFSWVLEDNMPMRVAAERLGGAVYKTYRIYEG
ncbi:MAG: N-acetyltransferase [Candidatus Eisenbacteria bacterium]|nr:N-acetyltransferase [Candidatus Eisenbacteria bacterium]